MKSIKLGGKTRPAALNGYSLEILADITGQDFTTFFQNLQEGAATGKIDIKALNSLIYSVLKGGALETGEDFNTQREVVASWVNFTNMEGILVAIMEVVTSSLPENVETEQKKTAKTSQSKKFTKLHSAN